MAVEFKTYKPGRRMRIKILSPTILEGQDVEPGQEVNALQDEALTLIGSSKAFALDPKDPGYKQPATGPDGPVAPDGTYGRQRPQTGYPEDLAERNADGTYADGSLKEKPADSHGGAATVPVADPKRKLFYEDAPKEPKGRINAPPLKPNPPAPVEAKK